VVSADRSGCTATVTGLPPRGAASGRKARERPPPKRDSEVLEAAARVFAERGYAKASVQDVADDLGISRGSVYHYIDTKEDLLYSLLEQVAAGLDLLHEEVATAEGLAPLERIALYVRLLVLNNLDNLMPISVYYHDVEHLSEARRTRLQRRGRGHRRYLISLINEAQSQALIDAGRDPRVVADCILATIVWTYSWYRPNDHIGREGIADICVSFAMGGIAGSDTQRASPGR
jgi:TetR/AcrR family transcriptional regulator, cholesterol catabolism regulator